MRLPCSYSHADEQVGPTDTFHGGDGKPQFTARADSILIWPHAPIEKITAEELRDGKIYPSDYFSPGAQIGT